MEKKKQNENSTKNENRILTETKECLVKKIKKHSSYLLFRDWQPFEYVWHTLQPLWAGCLLSGH